MTQSKYKNHLSKKNGQKLFKTLDFMSGCKFKHIFKYFTRKCVNRDKCANFEIDRADRNIHFQIGTLGS